MKTIINLCVILSLCFSFELFAAEADEQSKTFNQLRADIILTQDALWDLCFYHINELGAYTKSFRKIVCNSIWLPDAIKGFVLNAHPNFLNKIDDLLEMIYELKREEYKTSLNGNNSSSESNQDSFVFYDNILKEQRFASYNTPEVIVRHDNNYEFRKESKSFCKTFNVQSYLIVEEQKHAEECNENCISLYPYIFQRRQYQEEEYHYGHKSLFHKMEYKAKRLYECYLKEHPFEIHLTETPNGRVIFTFLKNRVPFHIWLEDKVYEVIRNRSKEGNNAKKYLLKDLPVILEKILFTLGEK